MIAKLGRKLDTLLWHRGFHRPEVRAVMRNELLFSVPLLFLGLCLLPAHSGLFWFAAGALLITWNFYGLARFIQRLFPAPWSQALLMGVLTRFILRFTLSALFLYGAFVWCKAPVWAVVSGITGAMGLLAATALAEQAAVRNRQKEA